MANNHLSNETVGNITDVVYVIGVVPQIGNAIISILTIMFNLLILITMNTHRRIISEVVRHQLISLSASDLISGISPGVWCLCLFPSINQNARVCSAIHMIFSTCQYATLLNLCHLSARRWCVLRNYSRPSFTPTRRIPLVFIFTSLAWILSLIAHLPALSSFTSQVKVNGCLSPELFETPSGVIYLVPLYGITLLALDIFYVHSIATLKRSEKVVVPRSENTVYRDNQDGLQTGQINYIPNTTRQIRNEANFHGIGNTRTMNSRKINRTQFMQRKAFKHLLVALIVSNVAILPYLGIIICFVLGIITANPDNVFVIDMQVSAANSLLNPFIYGIYLAEVRLALRENVQTLKFAFLNMFKHDQSVHNSPVAQINVVSNTVV